MKTFGMVKHNAHLVPAWKIDFSPTVKYKAHLHDKSILRMVKYKANLYDGLIPRIAEHAAHFFGSRRRSAKK